jgi:hypothetical protein
MDSINRNMYEIVNKLIKNMIRSSFRAICLPFHPGFNKKNKIGKKKEKKWHVTFKLKCKKINQNPSIFRSI